MKRLKQENMTRMESSMKTQRSGRETGEEGIKKKEREEDVRWKRGRTTNGSTGSKLLKNSESDPYRLPRPPLPFLWFGCGLSVVVT